MDRRFSIATLLLLTTIAAMSLASMRMALVRLWTEGGADLLNHMIVGGGAGAFYGVALAIWNRPHPAQLFVAFAGGATLGAAAGAQLGLEAPWAVILVAPFVIVALAALVGLNRQRQLLAAEAAGGASTGQRLTADSTAEMKSQLSPWSVPHASSGGLGESEASDANPFAAPRSLEWAANGPAEQMYWREGNLLVVLPEAELPPRCPRCNAPVDEEREYYDLIWFPPFAYFGLAMGVLPFPIIYWLTRQRLGLSASVCQRHRRRRMQSQVVYGAGIALLVVCFVSALVTRRSSGICFVIIALIAALFFLLDRARTIRPKRIASGRAWIAGCSPEFLSEIPEI